jgi:cupin 2 domain-containing protein
MPAPPANLFDTSASDPREEHFSSLVEAQSLKIERIVSYGQASPAGFWFDQDFAEWVAVLAGSAGLRFEGEAELRVLAAGDHILIPARRRHRVEWTDQTQATVWLAVHFRA